MGDLVNLKRFKKRADRNEAAKKAETNRALFGRTLSEKNRDKQSADRANQLHDAHRIGGEAAE